MVGWFAFLVWRVIRARKSGFSGVPVRGLRNGTRASACACRVCGGRFCGAVWCGQDMGAVCGVAFWRLVWCDGCMERVTPADVFMASLDEEIEAMIEKEEVPGLPGVTKKDLEEIRAGLERLEGRGQYVASPR